MNPSAKRLSWLRRWPLVSATDYPLRLRMRLALAWRISFASVALGVMTARIYAWTDGAAWGSWPTLVVMGVAGVAALLQYGLLTLRAGEAGLLLYNAWGFRRLVAWGAVRQVRLRRLPWLLYAPALALELDDGRTAWLPRDSHALSELHALGLRVAGPGHPLVQALQTPLHAL